jgi:hypothetical protein
MQKQILVWTSVLVLSVYNMNGQKTKQDSTYKRFFIGSSLFTLANLNVNDPNKPDFFQLNFGYRISPKNVVSIELKTWKYAWPLGIPYGKSFEAPSEKYPGYVRDIGVALAYQRFLWKGVYAAIHAFNAKQTYYTENKQKIHSGYQLFLAYRLGYHIQLFKNRFFIEPSVAMTHWPIKTNTPESFVKLEKKWPNYFIVEPGLHFGVKF